MRYSVVFAAMLASAAAMTSFDLGAQTSAAPAGPTAVEIADKVQNFYNQTKTYKADFKQEYFIKMHNNRQTSQGQVAFEKPGKMSWQYDQPNGTRVVSNGQELKIYQAAMQQMIVQPVTHDLSGYSLTTSWRRKNGTMSRCK
jgi:outer membrane lipoprotein carrier protein